jgi:hypothetical protein
MVELPEICPICGGKTERGVIRVGGGGIGARVVWGKPDSSRWFGGGETLKNSFLVTDFFRGVRCPRCKIVIFNYGEEKEE